MSGQSDVGADVERVAHHVLELRNHPRGYHRVDAGKIEFEASPERRVMAGRRGTGGGSRENERARDGGSSATSCAIDFGVWLLGLAGGDSNEGSSRSTHLRW